MVASFYLGLLRIADANPNIANMGSQFVDGFNERRRCSKGIKIIFTQGYPFELFGTNVTQIVSNGGNCAADDLPTTGDPKDVE
jgi:hypothetical protein